MSLTNNPHKSTFFPFFHTVVLLRYSALGGGCVAQFDKSGRGQLEAGTNMDIEELRDNGRHWRMGRSEEQLYLRWRDADSIIFISGGDGRESVLTIRTITLGTNYLSTRGVWAVSDLCLEIMIHNLVIVWRTLPVVTGVWHYHPACAFLAYIAFMSEVAIPSTTAQGYSYLPITRSSCTWVNSLPHLYKPGKFRSALDSHHCHEPRSSILYP